MQTAIFVFQFYFEIFFPELIIFKLLYNFMKYIFFYIINLIVLDLRKKKSSKKDDPHNFFFRFLFFVIFFIFNLFLYIKLSFTLSHILLFKF